VKNKLFAMYSSPEAHHGGGRPGAWVKAQPGQQQLMINHAPDRFFMPPYVGTSGWIGVRLDKACNWKELDLLLRDAWRLTAPKRLAKLHADTL
jgi:hypothetical protein